MSVPLSTHHHFKNLTGQKFGRLFVREFVGKRGSYHFWECVCDCGRTNQVQTSALTRGLTQSCGCLLMERIKLANTKHGLTKSRIHVIWVGMIQRCQNPNATDYRLYGGRGVLVCERWQTFENFVADMGQPPSKNHTLDRIDGCGNYELSNCRWATSKEQARNKRTTVFIELDGVRLSAPEWDERMGLPIGTVRNRFRRHGDARKAILAPLEIHQRSGAST